MIKSLVLTEVFWVLKTDMDYSKSVQGVGADEMRTPVSS